MSYQFEIAKALKSHNKIKFLWIGDGPDHESLQKRAVDEGVKNIDFLGFVKNEKIYNYLSISDIYLSTSRREGMPFALIEATSMGLPIVATDVIGNNEVCIDEINGYLINQNDVKLAKRKILELYRDYDLRKKMSSKAKETYNKYFSIQKMVASHKILYNDLLEK